MKKKIVLALLGGVFVLAAVLCVRTATFASRQLAPEPVPLDQTHLAMIHGTNERIRIERYAQAVQFFVQVIRNATSAGKIKGST